MVKETVVRKLQEKDNIKFRIVLVCLMEKPDPSGKKPEVKEAHFRNKTTTKLSDDDVSEMYDDASEKIWKVWLSIRKREVVGSSKEF
jgi:hypothetical protein